MTDEKELRSRIEESGYKYNYIAKVLGITYYGLLKKLKNESEFKVSEVLMLSEVLGLTKAEREKIFFNK